MSQRRLAWSLWLTAVASMGTGCLPSISDLDQQPLSETFAVSDYFAPSGYMGDGEYFGDLVGLTNEGCMPRPAGARGNCYKFTYFPNNLGMGGNPWAGVFWVFPANSWGSSSGRAIDVSRFQQISFWAAIDGPTPFTQQAGSAINMIAQGGGINPMGTYSQQGNGQLDYVDGVYANNAWTIGDPNAGVTTTMKQFHIPLTAATKGVNCQEPNTLAEDGKAENCTGNESDFLAGTAQAKFLVGAFAWSLAYPSDAPQCADPHVNCHVPINSAQFVNPPPVHIYLDDIVWDTEPPPTSP